MKQLPYSDIILKLIHSWDYDVDILGKMKKEFSSKHKLSDIPTNIQSLTSYRELLNNKKIKRDQNLEKFLTKRWIRSQSGIVSVQVLTKPWHCPGQCIFCPNEEGMPKSYISSEPWAMRAALNKFDPIKQVYNRLRSLSIAGHTTDKIEMIVLGWTWDVYTKEYKIKFIKSLYDACNTFSKLKLVDSFPGAQDEKRYKFKITNIKDIKYPKTIKESIKKNEKAKNRIIWLTLETRPEYVTDENCMFWRELWVTRIEMWVQSLYDDVLDANKRGHGVEQIRLAFEKLRRYGLKISVHIMPGLYKSTYAKDLWTFKKLYSDEYLKPDEIKFYPTSVIPNTPLHTLYKKGEYKPLTTVTIKKLIKKVFLDVIPAYTRIKRLIRDIPATEIVAWSNITNLGQLMHNEMKLLMENDPKMMKEFYSRLWENYKIIKDVKAIQKVKVGNDVQTFILWKKPDLKSYRNFVSLDTRSREIRNKGKNNPDTWVVNLVIRRYQSSVGTEYFISFEDQFGYLYGFTRLLLWPDLAMQGAMIRELHVYGQVERLKVKWKQKKSVQHKWFGKQLMEVAENIAKQSNYDHISVISWVWVREYYRKLWYTLKNTYMVKKI